MASRIFSIRLDDSAVQALERLQTPDDDSLNGTVKRVLLTSLGMDVNIGVQPVNNTVDQRIQELVDIAINDLRRNLEGEINKLKSEIKALKVYSDSVNNSPTGKTDRTASSPTLRGGKATTKK